MWLFSSFNYYIIILVIVVLTQIINVSTVIVKSVPYKNYDSGDTTIYKFQDSLIKNKYGDGYKDSSFTAIYSGMYSVEKHTIKNGSVLSSQINTLFQNNNFIKFSDDGYWRSQLVTTSGIYCSSDQNLRVIDSGNKINQCLRVMDYSLREVVQSNDNPAILSITWIPQSSLHYLRIVYMFKRNVYYNVKVKLNNENDVEIYSLILDTNIDMTELTIQSEFFHENRIYKIIFIKIDNVYMNTDTSNVTNFGIFQVTNIFPYSYNVNDSINNKHINDSLNKCLNGGYRNNDGSLCICPPGFKGIFCEEGCGPNSYGADCSGLCSILTKGCRGMYFCTDMYGCTCPVGLTGPFCDEDCSPYNYGADCIQRCPSTCFNNTCDQYTGVCSQGCLHGYVTPNCNEKYTAYLQNSPKLISAGPETITIEINFELENIKDINEHINAKYYQLLWMASDEHTYTSSEVKLFYFNKTQDTISDLKSDTTYSIGVLLIMEDGNYDNQSIVFSQYKTTCNNPNISESNIQVTERFKSISVTWDRMTFSRLECSIAEFVISLQMNNQKQNYISNTTDIYNIIPISKHSYDIYDVIPGNEYIIKVTPRTKFENLPSLMYFATPKITNEDLIVKNITAKMSNHNKISLSWICVNTFGLNNAVDDVPVTFIVKYKINRILSCSLEEIKNNWTVIKVHNSSNFEILDVIPNTQYMIQVVIDSEDDDIDHRENMIYVLTPATRPTSEPVLNTELPKNITNNSISVNWKMNYSLCSKINGFFVNYVIELKEYNENKTVVRETKSNNLYVNELNPNTYYKLKIFIKNHVGYNSKYFLLIDFKTKYDLASVDDLIIYKKSFKNRMLGLRWSYSDVENLDGFFISVYDDTSKNFKNETVIPPIACLAWPHFYCYTFYNLNFNNNHTIKVRAKSLEYPEGGKASSIHCNSIDGIPDSPSNFKAIEIGKTNLTVQWDVPWIFNGELKSFILNVEETSSVDIQACCENITPVEIPFGDEQPIYTYTLKNLRPGSTYSIGVLSKSSWYGSPSRIQVTTLI